MASQLLDQGRRELRGEVVRVVLALVLHVDRGGEARRAAVRRDKRRGMRVTAPVAGLTTVRRYDRRPVELTLRRPDVLVDEEELVERLRVQPFERTDEAQRELTIVGQRGASGCGNFSPLARKFTSPIGLAPWPLRQVLIGAGST